MNRFFFSVSVLLFAISSFGKSNHLQESVVYSYKTKAAGEIIEINGQQYRLYDDIIEPIESRANKFARSPQKWTNGKVFYTFAEDVSEENRARFIDAAQEWSRVAQLEFIERSDEPNYIYVQNDNRNYAIVGMAGGKQILSIVTWGSKFVIVHEIGHALGMWHEHQRSDRDDYVTIRFDNIQSDQQYNFTTRDTDNLADYDFLSIMHYPLSAYTSNGQPTIEPKPEYQSIAAHSGQRRFISAGDQLGVAIQYGAKPIAISDPALLNFLVQQFDTNGDQLLDSIEVLQIENLTTPGQGQIQSLEGIEHFRNLKHLTAANENLTAIPPLPPLLETLDVSNNQIADLATEASFGLFMQQIKAQGNPLDVYDCSSIQFIRDTLGENNLIINPLQDGSSLVCDEEANRVLINGKARTNLNSKGARYFYIDVPAGQSSLTFTTSVTNNSPGGLMDMFVAYQRIPSQTDYDYLSNNSDNLESITVQQPAAGRWYVSLIPNDRSFENVDLIARYQTTEVQQRRLTLNTQVSDLQAAKGQSLTFYLDLEQPLDELEFVIAGGEGDADLYLRYQQQPSLSQYDCRPYREGNDEVCRLTQPASGRYYVTLVAYRSFSGVTLEARGRTDATTSGQLNRFNLSGFAGEWRHFAIDLPQGVSHLKVTISGGSGDADLYLNQGQPAGYTQYQCRPYRYGNQESCQISAPQPGRWYLSINGYSSYSGLTLSASWE